MKKEKIYCAFLIFIIFGIFQYGIQKICGFTLIPDEFGYWASAAKNVGYDWAEVASLGSYYSFGYSFILTPILGIFCDGVSAYRVALAVNMLLMCAGVFLLMETARRLFPKTEENKRIFSSGIAVLYPPWIFYMQMTMVEALLYFLFVLIVFLFVCFVQNPKISTAILLAASLIYIYCVHMRTIGVLIACVIAMGFWMALEHQKGRVALTFWGVLLILAALAIFWKQAVIMQVFTNAEAQTLAGNDYGGQWEKLSQILTVHGMVQLVKEILCKVYYLGMASAGLFYWGIGWAIRESVFLLKKFVKKEKGTIAEWTAFFILLSATGEILISSIYMYRGGWIDTLIYGRYDEFLMPVFLLTGILTIGKSRRPLWETMLIGAGTGLFTVAVVHIIKVRNLEGLRGYMVSGISYLLKEEQLDIPVFFRNTWFLMCSIMLVSVLCVRMSEKSRKATWFLTVLLAVEIAAGIQISHHYTYRVNNANFVDLSIAEMIIEQTDTDGQVLYLDEGMPEYVDFIQMQLGARPIRIIKENQFEQWNPQRQGVLIAHVDTQYQEELEGMFQQCLKANTFYLFYNKKEGA